MLSLIPLNFSVDVLLGVEAEDSLKNISSRLATKWKQPSSWACGYIKSRVYITLVCAIHHFIWRSLVLVHTISVEQP